MGIHGNTKGFLVRICLLLAGLAIFIDSAALARGIAPAFTPAMHRANVPVHHRSASRSSKRNTSTTKSSRRITQYLGRRRRDVIVTGHHGRHHKGRRSQSRHVASSRHAYPMNFFMLNAPDFDRTPLPTELSQRIHTHFTQGEAEAYPTRSLVRSGIVALHPMHGGIFWRREPVKYIIVHSTETGRPIGATQVIDAWSSLGRRHAGAQYAVDRDGSIYQAVDPDLATVHVNIFKTLPGINNDNSIGIEMVHAGSQTYPPEQKQAVIRLVTYLQDRYKVEDENIITHRYAQQGDHTDPVAFDWDGFLANQKSFHMHAIARRMNKMGEEIAKLTPDSGLQPAVYMQPHGKLSESQAASRGNSESSRVRSAAEGNTTDSTTAAPAAAEFYKRAEQVMQSTVKRRVQPALRGPIEMDPHTATILNSVIPESDSVEGRSKE